MLGIAAIITALGWILYVYGVKRNDQRTLGLSALCFAIALLGFGWGFIH